MNTHRPELTNLTARDFPDNSVWIHFEDDSVCTFQSAFYRIEAEHWTVIYTEHCGYLAFLTKSIDVISGEKRT